MFTGSGFVCQNSKRRLASTLGFQTSSYPRRFLLPVHWNLTLKLQRHSPEPSAALPIAWFSESASSLGTESTISFEASGAGSVAMI